ncbi:(2E,6E)-farnesyl diphosphate synthase [Shewanella yunxiaonensis]|uniref:(2E,6E)-farnesyl diphosphate synthase n=1 Tax=Shewanella yunxiaonensis TaxID=2829809 RepID=A0ABX7YQ30_9GAMM|nr:MULTISPECIES: (2E,6E)-farnesyl diphosphate synthase [Shewanella]MDF0534512.1 (2E,6E)-farnesyl diphosphate synthase [Shewanella sp. A32]QUN04863.1 (2E,6E)-farnesyl diphosphate synthase [Shewanella yunxiaonensis]
MLTDAINRCQQRINQHLTAIFDALPVSEPRLQEAMRYGVLLGGKRVRPFLVYSVGEMLGVAAERLDNCAAAIECIHAYSLIHDDLPAMDNDELRRGQPTVHVAFDEATAILAGDALQTLAFELISQETGDFSAQQQLLMIKALANASGYLGMCGGQALDLAATDKEIPLSELTRLHRLKTGALIRCAVQLAVIAANVDAQQRQQLLAYADAIGLAFQVQDDILDITSSTEELGKPQGSDTRSNKSTYPKLLGLAGAKATAEALLKEALSALGNLPYNSRLIAEFARYIIERRV